MASASSQLRSAALGIALAACGSSGPSASAPRIGKVLGAVLAAAGEVKAPWRCAAADTPALANEEVKTGERRWQVTERTLKRLDDDNEIVIGVIADAAGANPRTVAALGRLRALLDAASPDLVLTLGGMGAAQAELEATLGTFSDRSTWPLVALPGDLENETAQTAAIAALRKRGDVVLDGRLVRWIELPSATIGTLPGAGTIERLVAGDEGCAWRAEDIAKLYSALTAKKGLRIAASAEAPRQMIDGEPAGELALTPSNALPIELLVHGPVQPSPSRATTGSRDGLHVALSPGTADATTRLPTTRAPAAGVLVLRGTAWSWRPLVDNDK